MVGAAMTRAGRFNLRDRDTGRLAKPSSRIGDRDRATPPQADPANVPVPPDLESLGFRDVLAKAQAPKHGGRYTLDLAAIGRLANWGIIAAPRRGDRIIAIAFPSCGEAGSVRPAVIVLANGGAVRQQSVALPAGCSGAPRG